MKKAQIENKKLGEELNSDPSRLQKFAQKTQDIMAAEAGVVGIGATALGGANLLKAQSRALSGQGGGSSSFGMGGDGFGFGASAGPGGSSFGMGGGGFGGVGDLSGTGFSIGMSGGNYRETARKLDAMIQQLMQAIAMGNFDAISSAITLLTMKSKTTMIGASLQVIQQMRQYDNQMKTISDQMGKLDSKDSNYQSRLAGLNANMQTSSMGRQAIANTLRDIAGMNEEMTNFDKSFLDMKSRTQANYARWT